MPRRLRRAPSTNSRKIKRNGGAASYLTLREKFDAQNWSVQHHQTVTASGVPSEVLIAERI